MLNVGKGKPIDVEFFSGKTSEGKMKTIAKCKVGFDNIPYLLRETFITLYCDDAFSTIELEASCVCSHDDKYNEALGKKIARKKLLYKYFRLLNNLIKENISNLEYMMNMMYADSYEIDNIQARLNERIDYMNIYGEPYEE